MSLTINADRFTRLNQSLSGKFLPAELAGLSEYLAGEGGEINYSIKGTLTVDHSGSQQRRVKCIIRGWFLLIDPVTLAVVRHTLDIDSSLVLVEDESGLPPCCVRCQYGRGRTGRRRSIVELACANS